MTLITRLTYGYFIVFLLLVTATVHAQQKNIFDAAVMAIKKNIQCCSAVFPGDHSFKVTTATIFSGGSITIVFNKNHVPFSFNLFELYKDVQAPLGVYYKTGGKTIEFKIDEMKSQAIRFNSAAKAKHTYENFRLILQTDHKNYTPGLSLTTGQTVDSINSLLRISNNDRAAISLLNDRVFKTMQMPSIRYDIDVAKLNNSGNEHIFQVRGLAFKPYVKDGFGAGARICFQNGNTEM